MPFAGNPYLFNDATLNTVNEVGGVYGLFQQTTLGLRCLYVGLTDNFRRRLREHYNNPPIRGATHFLAEVIGDERARAVRESALIAEFNPPGNSVGTR